LIQGSYCHIFTRAIIDLSTPEHLLICDHLLSTTRTVRKRLDLTCPIEPAIIEACLKIAIQAPTGSNQQGWHFVVASDADKRARIAELYRQSCKAYRTSRSQPKNEPLDDDAHAKQMRRFLSSTHYLVDHLHEVPVLILACVEGRVENRAPADQAALYGSILPAAWSLMMALRARGHGAVWTNMHIRFEKEVAALLDLPGYITQAVLFPVAYFIGKDFKPAQRKPIINNTHWNSWGNQR